MADTIKEFLVGLGFKVSDAQQKRFNDSISRATKSMEVFAKTTGAAVAAIAYSLDEITLNLENFYYVAQRSNTTVGNLTAIRFAADQIGVGADEITASISRMARLINSNPIAYAGIFRSMGIEIMNVDGTLKDTTNTYIEFVRKMKEQGAPGTMGYAVAVQRARLVGMGEDELLAAEAGLDKFVEANARAKQLADRAGLDWTKEAKNAVELQNALGLINADLKIFGGLMVESFYKPVKSALEATHEFLVYINDLDQQTDHWSTRLIAVGEAIGGVIIAMKALRAVGALFGGAAATGVESALLPMLLRFAPWMATLYAMRPYETNRGEDENVAKLRQGRPDVDATTVPRTPTEDRSTATSRAMQYFQKQGWNRSQAAGIVANLMAESKLQEGAVGDSGSAYGIAQWHPDRQKDFANWAGHDIRNSTLEEQMAFVNYELREGSRKRAGRHLGMSLTPGGAGNIVSNEYESPADRAGQARLRSLEAERLYSGAVSPGDKPGAVVLNLNQETNITVNGSSDPAATGNAVAGAQKRVNGDLVRNFKNPMQ